MVEEISRLQPAVDLFSVVFCQNGIISVLQDPRVPEFTSNVAAEITRVLHAATEVVCPLTNTITSVSRHDGLKVQVINHTLLRVIEF